MFPWQHILEAALMQNVAIQLSNDVTVTLFLNQSLQNVEVFLKLISGTSVQNFSEKMLYIAMVTPFLSVLRQNWVLEIIGDFSVTSFCNQSQRNFLFLFIIPKRIFLQNWSKIGRETKKLQKKAK